MGRSAAAFAWPWLAVAALALGGGLLFWILTAPEPPPGLRPYREEMAARGAVAPVADLAAAARDSVYLVTVELPSGQRSPVGTAFVVERRDGTKALATSARVADLFRRDLLANPDFNGGRMIAAQPRPPDYPALRVTAVEVHPAWDALGRASQDNAYDVALLLVDNPARLGPPLSLARQSVLETLKAGDALVLVGYVGGDLGDSDLTRPVPGTASGIVTALTSFRLVRGNDAENLLVQTSLPAADAAAGSPLLDVAGSVVGVFEAGDPAGLLHGTASDVPVLVTFAGRSDVLAALAAGTAAEGLGDLVEAWAGPAPDPLDQLKARARPDETIAPVFQGEATLRSGDPQFPDHAAAWFEVAVPVRGLYLALVRSAAGSQVLAVIAQADGHIADIGTAGAASSSAMARTEAATTLRLGAIGTVGEAVSVQLYRAAAPGL